MRIFRRLASFLLGKPSCADFARQFRNHMQADAKFYQNFTERLSKKLEMSDDLVFILVTEYARYMALKATSDRDFEVPSKLVDEVWHLHLQFNRDYEMACRSVFGRLIYHVPGAADNSDASLYSEAYKNTLYRYDLEYGTPLEAFWGAMPERKTKIVFTKNDATSTAQNTKNSSQAYASDSSTVYDDGGVITMMNTGLFHTPSTDATAQSGHASADGGSSPASSCGSASSCGGGSGCGGGGGCGGS